jgi:signal transduction histidine kinase
MKLFYQATYVLSILYVFFCFTSIQLLAQDVESPTWYRQKFKETQEIGKLKELMFNFASSVWRKATVNLHVGDNYRQDFADVGNYMLGEIRSKHTFTPLLPVAYFCMSEVYTSLDEKKSSEYIFLAYEEATKQQDKAVLSEVCWGLGNRYYDNHEYAEALKYYLVLESLGMKLSQNPTVCNTIALCYQFVGDETNMWIYFQKALYLAEKQNNIAWIGILHTNMSKVFEKQKNYPKTIQYLEKSVKCYFESKQSFEYATDLAKLSVLYWENQEQAKAFQAIQKSREVLDTISVIDKMGFKAVSNCLGYYVKFYTWAGKTKEALRFSEKIVEMQKQEIQRIKAEKTTQIQTKYNLKFKEQEIKTLQHQKQAERWFLYLVALVTISVIALAFVLFRNNRRQVKTNALLTEQQEELNTQKDALALQAHELEVANQTKDKLFAILGHDLRSPIGSLEGMLSLMNMGAVSQEEFQTFVPQFHKNVKNMQHTLENLLQWSISQMRGMNANPISFNLSELIYEKIGLFTTVAQSKNIMLSAQTSLLSMVWADINQVRLILRNLINNAIKFTPEGGQISITAHVENNQAFVSVIDNGVGMSKEQMEKLFKKNHSFTTYGTSGEKGTGLGLSLCKDFVERNGGKIWVESEVGKGSSFIFTLPTKPATEKYPHEEFLVEELDNGGALYRL